jgi:polysaccharide pyruvyl transferase WcaK-like protein
MIRDYSEKVSKILILGVGRENPNLGIQMMACGTISFCKKNFPEANVSFLEDLQRAPKLIEKSFFNRIMFAARQVKESDLVLSLNGGDGVSSIYGFRRLIRIYFYGIIVGFYKKKYIFLPQDVGPFMDYFLVTGAYVSAPDISFLCSPNQIKTRKYEFDISLNISGLLWIPNKHIEFRTYRKCINELLRYFLGDNLRVALIPHVLGNNSFDSDLLPLVDIHEIYGKEIKISKIETLRDAQLLISKSKICIGARFHFCLNSIQHGIPTIFNSYSPKFETLRQYSDNVKGSDIEQMNFVVDVKAGVKDFMEQSAFRRNSDFRMNELKQQIWNLKQYIEEYL